MFRPLRRKNKAISQEATMQLLSTEKRAVLAVNGDDGYPYAIPVNYAYDALENKIYFHGASVGHKAESIRKDDRVCFTVYGNESRTEDDWAPLVQSAVVFGRCRLVTDPSVKLSKLRAFAMRYYPTEAEAEAEIQKDFRAVTLYEISVEHLCGKQIREK